jgi:flagellar assembly protein FliH
LSKIIKSDYVIIQKPQNIYDSLEHLKTTGDIDTENYLTGVSYGENVKVINDAIKKSKEIIEAANEYKNNVLANVTKEIEEYRKRGYEIGYTDAYEKGKTIGYEEGKIIAQKDVEEKKEDLIAELCKQIYMVEDSKDEVIKRYEKDLVKLATEIAEKIIRVKISQDDEIIKNILTNAIKDYRNVEWLKIYLSKNDYVTVSTDKNIMEKLYQISEHIALEAMTDVEDGELIIESPENLIDLGINTQLSNLKNAIK